MTIRLTTVLLALVCGAASAQGQVATPAEQEVLAVVNALFDGMRKVDSALVRPLFHPKARLITVDLRREGSPAQIEESAEDFIRSIGQARTQVYDERISNVKMHIDGSMASVWADYRFYLDTTFRHCGVDHFLLVKESGKWLIIELADTRRTLNCG